MIEFEFEWPDDDDPVHMVEPGPPECCAPSPQGFVCSEPRGHVERGEDLHIAMDTEGEICDMWAEGQT